MSNTSLITYRGLVMAHETDSNGHMNVQYYTTKYDQAGGQLLAMCNVDLNLLKDQHLGFAYVEMNIQYLREVMEDDPIHITTQVQEIGSKVVTIRHQMWHSVQQNLASEAIAKWLIFDKNKRKAVELPAEISAQMQALISP